ncbi:apolipoprotein M [Astyanax mexicanus]|uniref:Apolipoprotein M n=1 Tax=Astyanax mexicanus TaxID=7994 RepID=A0A3B1JAD0_ASTMX|nr:apolipoprotein M [Astyanax mexicanus]
MIGDVLTILYAVLQLLVPSLPPAPLSSTALLTNDKYLGKWYFVGVASWDTDDIQGYQGIDNSMAELKKTADGSLEMTATMLKGDQCLTMSWTYKVDASMDPIMEEGDNIGMAFDGKWIDCDSCMLILKIHPEETFFRIMLFARTQDARGELVEKFKTKMESYWVIDQFVIPPQTKDFCKLE